MFERLLLLFTIFVAPVHPSTPKVLPAICSCLQHNQLSLSIQTLEVEREKVIEKRKRRNKSVSTMRRPQVVSPIRTLLPRILAPMP
ncbi:hypothetical protein GE09DRAFT_185192 [Coniochaeta sp. 2T2.1]|nr:hypothetical protein GE09DRAFT_185192 [Coniochaeta sp. 2T2.1]